MWSVRRNGATVQYIEIQPLITVLSFVCREIFLKLDLMYASITN